MVSSVIEKELKRLPNLYKITGLDWQIEISNSLTEPVCPTVRIFEECRYNKPYSRYCERFDNKNIHSAVKAAVDFIIDDMERIKEKCPKIK